MSCAECGKEARWRCALCAERYCSRECQKRAWPLHGAAAHEASAAARLESRGATRDSARMILQSDLGVLTAPGVGADMQGRMGIALVPRAEIGAKRQRDVILPFRWHRDAESGEADTASVITGESLEKEAQAVRPEDFLPIAESWARMVTRVDVAKQSPAYRGQLENFAYRLYAWHNETIAAYAYQVGADPNARWTLVPASDQADDLYTTLSWLLMPGRTWMTAMPQRAVTVGSDIFLSMIKDGLKATGSGLVFERRVEVDRKVFYEGPEPTIGLEYNGNDGSDWTSLVFHPRGSFFYSLSFDNVFTTWDTSTRKIVRRFKISQPATALAVTEDWVFVAVQNSVFRVSHSDSVMLTHKVYNSPILKMIVMLRNNLIITAHENGEIAETGVERHDHFMTLYTVPVEEGKVFDMSTVDDNDAFLYVSTSLGTIFELYEDGDETHIGANFYRNANPAQPRSRNTVLVSAPNGRVLYTGDSGGTITFWDKNNVGDKLTTIETGDEIKSIKTNPQGSRLFASTLDECFIFDTATGQRLSTVSITQDLEVGLEFVSDFAISPDGRRMYAGIIFTTQDEEEDVDEEDKGFIRVYDLTE